ncbi:hypothetical protein D3C76_1255240 [compost metagenome]
MRLATSMACSMSRTLISAPRPLIEVSMIAARSMVGINLAMLAATLSRNPASGLTRMAWASSSCSAWENRSMAIQSGSVWPSHTTRISEGPAIMSMPTWPNTWRLAVAT